MKHILIQIAVLLTLFVATNAGSKSKCAQKGLKPVNYPPEEVIGEWQAPYCIDSPLCSKDVDCVTYPLSKKDDKFFFGFYGYNKTSGKLVEGSNEIEFTKKPGRVLVRNVGTIKLADFYVLLANKQLYVLYACLTDFDGASIPAGWIVTRSPKNKLKKSQRTMALKVLKKNGLKFKDFYRPTYKYCKKVEEMKKEMKGDLDEEEDSEDEDSEDKGSEDKGSEDKGSEDKGSDVKGSEDKGSEDKGSEDKDSEDKGSEDKDSEDKGSEDKDSEDEGTED